MLRKLRILTLLIAGVAACASNAPSASVTGAAPTRTEAPISQPIATSTAPATFPALPPATIGELKLTILYDNTAIDSQLRSAWGFAALVEYGDHTLLFDTGGDGSILLDNMRQLSVDPRSIEAVIFSHAHDDHFGGLQSLLDAGARPTVYVLSTFSKYFKEQVRSRTQLVEVTGPLEILPGVHTTGPNGLYAEEALVVETRDGNVVITGCAHPGVAEMVRQAQMVVDGKIAYLVGGFHLYQTSTAKLPAIIAEVHQLGVEKVIPAHCTGNDAIAQFRTEYGDNYVEGSVGRTVTISAE